MMTEVQLCRQLDDLERIAGEMISFHNNNRIFALQGRMGVGKTTFIKSICQVLGIKDIASSPTFSIINEYRTPSGDPVYHFDFYRIKNIEEAMDIGYEMYFFSGFYCFIEWPEKITELLPQDCVYVDIEEDEATGNRIIRY